MRVGSLFTGYGGLDIAVGGELAWYAEIEPAACKVLEAHYPDVPNLGDITKINWSEVEPVDVLTGGYPCQPFSHAGLRKGKNDARHLWPHVRDAIHTLRPHYSILENVGGHITLGFASVLADLATIGFDAEWGTFRASSVGATHQRKRLFIVAYPNSAGRSEHGGSLSVQKELSTFERNGYVVSDTHSDGHGEQLHTGTVGSVEEQAEGGTQQRQRARGKSDSGSDWGKYTPVIQQWESVVNRVAPAPTIPYKERQRLNPVFVEWMMGLDEGHVTGHGLSFAQELKMLGNGVVPQQARAAVAQLMQRIAA
jgi:DNA (cytosine-5)-methyltransferase 1